MTFFSRLSLLLLLVTSVCVASPPPNLESRAELPAATQLTKTLTAADIIANAHKAAGGADWVKPFRLKLTGYNLIRKGDAEVVWDKYAMWREFASEKKDAHAASGKVRIEAWSKDQLALLLTFDGKQTYNQNGVLEDQSANAMWSSNFGYGAIRNALDKGWQQARLPDDLVDGQAAFIIKLTDPSGGVTHFGIRQSDYAIVYVGFDTPRGWHERRYSHFYSKPNVSWSQPGRVRLFYNGVKANEAIWTDFDVISRDDAAKQSAWGDALFTVETAPTKPTF